MRTPLTIAVAFLSALALACADKTPATFKYDPPPAAVTNTNYFSLHVAVVNKKGETIASQSPTYSGGPADVLEVSASGNLRCEDGECDAHPVGGRPQRAGRPEVPGPDGDHRAGGAARRHRRAPHGA